MLLYKSYIYWQITGKRIFASSIVHQSIRLMSATVTLQLDKRRAKKDGSYPIKILVVVNTKPLRISTGYSVEEKHWNNSSQMIKTVCKLYPNVSRVNNYLHKQRGIISEKITQLQNQERLPALSLTELKGWLTSTKTEALLISFGNEIIAELRAADKVGNARVYSTMLRSFETFLDDKDKPIKQISYKWLKHYEAWYLSRTNSNGKKNSVNGLSVHMRTLKALYNRAVKRELIEREPYPFASYTIKHEKTRKRAISEADIMRLKEVTPQTSRQQRAQDYFLMSFYLMGASFIDLAFLRKENIVDDRIEYKRKKTGQLHSIKITAPLKKLIDKYLEPKQKAENPYILNVIKGDTEQERYTAARDEMRRYNKALKELAKIAGVEAEVTSYTARHSYATIAKYKGVPTAVISEALGHQSEEITQVYLDSFDKRILDKYNELILGE